MSVDRIQAVDLQRHLSSPNHPAGPLVVDIRRQRLYQRSRIPGSHNIPAARLLSSEPPDRDLILVSHQEAESASVAEALYSQGYYRRIQHLAGGYQQWQRQGYPIEGSGYPTPEQESGPWWALLLNWRRRQSLRPCS
jgi:rhodanese-related sulfurtransferase